MDRKIDRLRDRKSDKHTTDGTESWIDKGVDIKFVVLHLIALFNAGECMNLSQF